MKPRFAVLLIVLTAVAVATVWRARNPRTGDPDVRLPREVITAPEFRLLDQFDHYVSLRGFLGRHQIVLAFFDARTGPEADPTLKQLMRFLPALKQAGVVVLAISAPLTPEQKQNARRLPFSVLRDTPAGHPGSVCLTWGTARATAGQTGPGVVSPAVFLIRRDGFVESDGGVPRPAGDPGLLIRQLLNE